MTSTEADENERIFRLKWEGYIILPMLITASVFILLGSAYKYGFPETYFAIGGAITILAFAFWALAEDLKTKRIV